MNLLGRFREEGWDRPPDLGLAVHWYARAAAGGDYRGQFNLGTMLAQGGKHPEAFAWFERALAAGDPRFRRRCRSRAGRARARTVSSAGRTRLGVAAARNTPVVSTRPV